MYSLSIFVPLKAWSRISRMPLLYMFLQSVARFMLLEWVTLNSHSLKQFYFLLWLPLHCNIFFCQSDEGIRRYFWQIQVVTDVPEIAQRSLAVCCIHGDLPSCLFVITLLDLSRQYTYKINSNSRELIEVISGKSIIPVLEMLLLMQKETLLSLINLMFHSKYSIFSDIWPAEKQAWLICNFKS